MKSSRVSLSGACAARAAYSSAFCQQYPTCSRMPLFTPSNLKDSSTDQSKLGDKDLGSIAAAALTQHGCARAMRRFRGATPRSSAIAPGLKPKLVTRVLLGWGDEVSAYERRTCDNSRCDARR